MKADPVSKGLLMNKKKEKRVVEGGGESPFTEKVHHRRHQGANFWFVWNQWYPFSLILISQWSSRGEVLFLAYRIRGKEGKKCLVIGFRF